MESVHWFYFEVLTGVESGIICNQLVDTGSLHVMSGLKLESFGILAKC